MLSSVSQTESGHASRVDEINPTAAEKNEMPQGATDVVPALVTYRLCTTRPRHMLNNLDVGRRCTFTDSDFR